MGKYSGFFLPILLIIFASPLSVSAKISISKKVNRAHSALLKSDLSELKYFEFPNSAEEKTLNLFETDSLTSTFLRDWLYKRVSYIVEDKDFKKFTPVSQKSRNSKELTDDDFPIIEKSYFPESKGGNTLMSNFGASIYYHGKLKNKHYSIKYKKSMFTDKRVLVKSPRVGILRVGKGLFEKANTINHKDDDSIANTIHRLSTLFHEARHSDGNKKSLGFFHSICPSDSDYAGLLACDNNLNGPYSIGAAVQKEFLKNCDSCSEAEKEVLRMVITDSLSRVVKKTYKVSDNPTERVANQLVVVKEAKEDFFKKTDSLKLIYKRAYNYIYEDIKLIELITKDNSFVIEESVNLDPTPEKDNGLLFDKSLIIKE